MVEHEHKKKDIWKTILIIWTIISILTILIMSNTLKGQGESLQDMYKNYQYIPEESEGFYCDKGKQYLCYGEDEYAISYNPKTDDVAQCNALKNEQATCLDEDQQISYCSSDQHSLCIDKDKDYVTCGAGMVAQCHTKGLYEIFSGTTSYSCNVGEYASCQNQ